MTKQTSNSVAGVNEQASQTKQTLLPPTQVQPKVAFPSKRAQTSKKTPAVKTARSAKTSRSGSSKKAGPSKQERVVAMLRRADGTTVVAVMKATGWQKHSVHGFLAGVVRKKLGLNLVSEKNDDTRRYRVITGGRLKNSPASRKRAAR